MLKSSEPQKSRRSGRGGRAAEAKARRHEQRRSMVVVLRERARLRVRRSAAIACRCSAAPLAAKELLQLCLCAAGLPDGSARRPALALFFVLFHPLLGPLPPAAHPGLRAPGCVTQSPSLTAVFPPPPSLPFMAARVVPAQLAFLAIFSPALAANDDAFRDQLVFYHSNKTTRRHDDEGDENERLRQIGLAQGMVDFARCACSPIPGASG